MYLALGLMYKKVHYFETDYLNCNWFQFRKKRRLKKIILRIRSEIEEYKIRFNITNINES